MTDLNIIPLKNNILVDFKHQEIKTKILNRINELGLDINKYKTDIEFLNLITNLVEHLIKKKDKIDKKNMVVSIFQHHFNLTEEEINLLKSNIDYLCNNGNVKKVSKNVFSTCFSKWIQKKE